jgi:hypothetical protein
MAMASCFSKKMLFLWKSLYLLATLSFTNQNNYN